MTSSSLDAIVGTDAETAETDVSSEASTRDSDAAETPPATPPATATAFGKPQLTVRDARDKGTIELALASLSDVAASAKRGVMDAANEIKAKTRAATHPPLPVVATFDDLLRFAKIASLNGAPTSEIEAFFASTGETVTVLDLSSVKQRVFIATDDARGKHTVSFRGTTNLANVAQNIRLSNNPVVASGRLASVGRSLSGAVAGLTHPGRSEGTFRSSVERVGGKRDPRRSESAASSASFANPEDSADSDSGSFDDDDVDDSDRRGADARCDDLVWSDDSFESSRRRGCTDHLPMHRGYRVIARACADALAPLMIPGYSVQLTGHSLGGAVAVAVALLFRSRGCAVEKVVTFGAPKLGPMETREAADQLDVLRVVQKDDIIPLLPMSRPFVRKPYVHLGEGIVLDNDAPGRYARLTREWGTAGILWKQRKHLGYARGDSETNAAAGTETGTGTGTGRNEARPVVAASAGDVVRGFGKDRSAEPVSSFASTGSASSAFVSADEPDIASSADESERRGRFFSARARLRRLREALGEGLARRRRAFAEKGELANARRRGGESPEVAAGGDADAETAEFAREVSEWASGSGDHAGGPDATVPSPRLANSANSAVSASARAEASLGSEEKDPAPFDDVEGELFVRVAETTSGGAASVAAAAADEWERAAAVTDGDGLASSRSPPASDLAAAGAKATEKQSKREDGFLDGFARVSRVVGPSARSLPEPSAARVVSGTRLGLASAPEASQDEEDFRAGPTIFEELWKLRGLDAESRGQKLESHRMRRYVEAIERAIAAGPVQTSLAGVYAGKRGDEIGIDFSEDAGEEEDGRPEGGVASWMTWTR